MSHTPGPWSAEFAENGGYDCMTDAWIVRLSNREIIQVDCRDYGQVHAGEPFDPIAESDARLIAAAPTMLDALKLIESVYRLNCVSVGEPSSVLAAVQAAIAKAEGQ